MEVIKLAFKNVTRVKGKSILIGIIMIVISIATLVSLSIYSGTMKTLDDTRMKLGNKVTLQINMKNIQKQIIENIKNQGDNEEETVQNTNESIVLTESIAKKYINSKYVSSYDYEYQIPLTTNLKVIGENYGESKNIKVLNKDSKMENQMPKLKLIGNKHLTSQEEFKKENKTIVEGRVYSEEESKNKSNVVVISKNLSNLNNLKLGESIEIYSTTDKNKSTKLKIIGLYEDTVQEDNGIPIPYMYRDNEIYSPITTVKNTFSKESELLSKATYFIDDPKNIQSFKKEVENSNLDFEKYSLDANDEMYKKMVGPLENLNSMIKVFLIIVIVTGSIIMILLMSISTRERKQEIGILRSLGLKRKKIIFQFITETLIVLSIALTIGIISGKTISQKTADYLLQKEIAAQEKIEKEDENSFGNIKFIDNMSSGKENVEKIDKIEIKVSSNEILYLIFVTLFVSSCGCVVSAYWIMKYEPMKILNNRV